MDKEQSQEFSESLRAYMQDVWDEYNEFTESNMPDCLLFLKDLAMTRAANDQNRMALRKCAFVVSKVKESVKDQDNNLNESGVEK